MTLNDTLKRVTDRVIERSADERSAYLKRMDAAAEDGPRRAHLACGNLAHAYAASPDNDKETLAAHSAGNIGIITAYNDMLSAHQPFERFPDLIREAAREAGGTAQVAGGVPAMCDGVTQGQEGMELSLFSRDVIAMAAGVGLSHNVFDTSVYLGVCDKIVPGLVIAAGTFGYLPAVFLPAGPMPSGISNDPVAKVLDEKAFVNGMVGMNATGGSTNLLIHLLAMAKSCGITITCDDIAEISSVVPLMARVYPNGLADVNHFHAAGGLGYMIGELLQGGLLHDDVSTVNGDGMEHYTSEPKLIDGELTWEAGAKASLNEKIVRPVSNPFQPRGGLKTLTGSLGTAVMKISAVKEERHIVEAPVAVFEDQYEVKKAFQAGDLDRDVIVVVRYQGPKANGMPELHSLTPPLAVLQDRGFKVALVTDGRMVLWSASSRPKI